MKKASVKLFHFILFFSISNILSLAQTNKNLIEITPQFGGKSFIWGEYNDESKQILEESGFLFSGGLISKIKFSRSIDLFTKIEAQYYGGSVDYDGLLQNPDGSTEPYKSKTIYQAFEATLNFGYDVYVSENFIIAPEFGFQYENWNRDIDNGGRFGYDEIYDVFLIDFGLNFIFPFSRTSKVYLNILAEYPVAIYESVNLASRGQGGPSEINLEPRANLGLNAEIGANIYGTFIAFYLDYLLFSKSAFDRGFHQPESDRTIIGLKLGYTFNIN